MLLTIPNVLGADLNVNEAHKPDRPFKSSNVYAWKLLPPYTDYKKYINQVLPDYVKYARRMTSDFVSVPAIPKKTYKLVKSWIRGGIPPDVAKHPFWMNPRLTRYACGTIVPDKIRVERERRLQQKK